MGYTESGTVEEPILEWLQEIGWTYVKSESIVRDYDEALDIERLAEAIFRLNLSIIKTRSDADQVVNKLKQLPNDIKGNQELFTWIKNEASLSLKAGQHSQTIKLIDYDHLENNTYTVTNQYRFQGYENIRPDIILFINGVPIILIECKTGVKEEVDYTDAVKQIIRYSQQAPQLFRYLAYTVATDGFNLRYGWTNEGRYARWRTSHENPAEGAAKELFRKETVLDFIQNFIVFETAHEEVTKKIAMQQQVEATNRIIRRVLSKEDDRGLVWHTQGSGKTLTMLYTAWKLKRQPKLHNPTIIVVIDRLQLQRQFRETFSNVGLPYVTWAETTRDLLDKIRTGSREVIITTIQKFRKPRYQDKRDNIIVMIDEAHRSQYGSLAIRMRETFPNAIIFGFTGTPIEKGPLKKSTFREFCAEGERYLHKYNIKQSIEDGSTVPLVYEPRLTKEQIPKEILDKEFLRVREGLSDEEQEEVLRKSAKLKTILKADHRVGKVAEDIAEHYTQHIEPNGFKAQLVAVDREACALYKEQLDKHLPPDYSMVIYSSAQNDPPLLRKYHMSSDRQNEVSRKEFQKRDTLPKILIVTDMLLTGFDAPIERAMYLDKPLRDHTLLQAIARTNRPYPGKDSALIVDYVGILHRLEDALNFEAEDIEGVAVIIDELKKKFAETVEKLRRLLSPIPREDTRQSQLEIIKLFTDEEIYMQFKENLSKLQSLYEAISPDPYLSPFLGDYKWFNQVNEYYNKWLRRDKESLKPYMEKTRQLIKESVILEDIDKTLPILKIGAEYLSKIEAQNLPVELEVAELRQAIAHYIRINIELNPLVESLGERLERIIRQKDPERIKQDLRDIIKSINEMEQDIKDKGITHEEHALLVVMGKTLPTPQLELIPFVKLLTKGLEDSSMIFKGWATKNETRKKVQKYIFEACFERFRNFIKGGELLELADSLMDYIVRYRS